MVNLLNKKKMAASSKQGKSKKKLTARVRIQNIQKLTLDLQSGIATPSSKDDPEYYKRNWPSIVEDAEEKIEEH